MTHLQIDQIVRSGMLTLKEILVSFVELTLTLYQFRNRSDGYKLTEDGVLMVVPKNLHDALNGEEVFGLELGPVLVDQFHEP